MAAAELFFQFTCTNCLEGIQGIRIHCVDCKDFELCLQCFASGAEIGPHKKNHSYQILDPGGLSIFRGKGGWSAREELRLLEAVEHYGFGNWEDISRHIETRSPEDAKEEYISKFLKGTIGRHTWQLDEDHKPNLIDHTLEWEESGIKSELPQVQKPFHDISPEEGAQLGYMPNRDDFEREYDSTAEQLVSNLALEPQDEDVEVMLKYAQVDIYRRRLRERARRKRIARDYQLISDFFRGNNKRLSQTTDERQLRESLRTFAQFYTHFDYEHLLSSLERERILRIQLTELFRYRWNGLTKLEEVAHFELHASANQNQSTGPWGHGKTKQVKVVDNEQLACINGPSNGQRVQYSYSRQILAGAPKRTHFYKRTIGHHHEDSVVAIKKKRRRKGNKLKFHRPKIHAPHRRPCLLRRIMAQQKLLG